MDCETYTKVANLAPGAEGQTIVVKVVAHLVRICCRQTSVVAEDHFRMEPVCDCADVLVGDETGCILFFAVHEQVDLMQTGKTFKLRNFVLELEDECLRLRVDEWGCIEAFEPALEFEIDLERNMSHNVLREDNFSTGSSDAVKFEQDSELDLIY